MKNHRQLGLFFLTAILLLAPACSSSGKDPPSMVGFWMDNDDNVTTIREKDGGYVAVTNYNFRGSSSQNTLVSSSYDKCCAHLEVLSTIKALPYHADGRLPWRYTRCDLDKCKRGIGYDDPKTHRIWSKYQNKLKNEEAYEQIPEIHTFLDHDPADPCGRMQPI